MTDDVHESASPLIGVLQESSLHATIKRMISRPGDRLEERVGTHVIDIVRGESLIEVQTGSFAKLRPKLTALLEEHPITVIYPVAAEKWLVYVDQNRAELSRRRSPRRGRLTDVVRELSAIASFARHRNLAVTVLLTRLEELRHDDGRGSWRRRGVSIVDRRLIEVLRSVTFSCSEDYLSLLPPALPMPFTNSELAAAGKIPRNHAQGITYCLRKMELLSITGKKGRELLFELVS